MVLEENSDGADVFWPGYVDAVTNLVLNLLFMLTIMIVAVFMFALELSRHKDDNPVPAVKSPTVEVKSATDTDETAQLNLKAKDEKNCVIGARASDVA
jgi:flagellar basal body-associated protein FliL